MCGNPFKSPSKSPKVPAAQKVDPTVTDVTNSQVSDDSGDAEASTSKKKKKQGFAATRLATLLSNAGSKDTLG